MGVPTLGQRRTHVWHHLWVPKNFCDVYTFIEKLLLTRTNFFSEPYFNYCLNCLYNFALWLHLPRYVQNRDEHIYKMPYPKDPPFSFK